MRDRPVVPAGALPWLVQHAQRLLHGVAEDPRLDRITEPATSALAPLSRSKRGWLLRGEWLGHAFHPLATDFTAGPWMAASFLDLFGPPASAPAARRLVALGLAASVPTWLSGLVDWQETRRGDRRVGLLHAATSTTAAVLYGASYLARRGGRHRRGVLLGLLGGLVAFGDGYVGGELSLVARAGSGRRTGSGDAADLSPEGDDLTVLETLEEVIPLVADDVFLRFSRGPADDRDRTSKDYESGLPLPGLSVVGLAPADWWDRPLEDWVARQICKYVHLRTEADDDRYAWLLRGSMVSRGPDSEPLVEGAVPLARLSNGLLTTAEAHYRERFDVARDST